MEGEERGKDTRERAESASPARRALGEWQDQRLRKQAEAELGSKLSVWILSYVIQQTNETTHTGSGNIPLRRQGR